MVPAVDSAVTQKLSSATLNYGPGFPGERCLRQSATDEKALVEVQVSRGEVPGHMRAKKIQIWVLGKGKINS